MPKIGTMEAFTRAVSSPENIKVYNFLLIVFSCLYVGAAVYLIPRFDIIGLIVAECLSKLKYLALYSGEIL